MANIDACDGNKRNIAIVFLRLCKKFDFSFKVYKKLFRPQRNCLQNLYPKKIRQMIQHRFSYRMALTEIMDSRFSCFDVTYIVHIYFQYMYKEIQRTCIQFLKLNLVIYRIDEYHQNFRFEICSQP